MIVSEDHIAILKALIHILPQEYYSASVEEALEIAVKLLENSNGLIVEYLEKIKEEIKEEEEKGIYFECEEWIEGRPCDEDYFYGLKRAIMIIDKHISELEGETNE